MSLISYAAPATDITAEADISATGISLSKITDNNISTHSNGTEVKITCTADTPLEGIYIKFNKIPTEGTLNGTTAVSENGFLHEFIHLNGKTSFTLEYKEADICDIFLYSSGELPKDVQLWKKGENETDLLLCATHSDDDQLFFAGLLPLYAGEKGLRVRVAYFINHYDTYNRTHELLDGLWHCGVTLYPDISPFPDGYSESSQGAMKFLSSKGIAYENILDFQRNLLNKYKPQVVVLHDFKGEYGHGAHILNTESFVEVCENPENGQYVPKKIYIHLYDKNTVKLDIDTPLSSFGGKSAFNVSQEAFMFHKSQHWTWFYKWIYGTNSSIKKASQINKYNPALYGLYYSSVGNDTGTNDLFENVVTYDEQLRLLEEKRQHFLNLLNSFADRFLEIKAKYYSICVK